MREKDLLTDLYTQETFLLLLDRKYDSLQEGSRTLFYIEFDDLARFNGTFGLDIDEQLLVQLGRVFRNAAEEEDAFFARVGTYRFAWISENLLTRESAYEKARLFLHLLQEPFCIGGNMFYVTASMGICMASPVYNSAAKMLKGAENAMREAQKKGTNHIAFASEGVNASLKTELRLMRDLPAAIESGEFYFVYQPQYAFGKGRFTGAELLARWRHPELGEISPGVFIPLAEKSGMIGPLTTKIIIETSRIFEILDTMGLKDFSISVNISPSVLMEKSFFDTVSFLMEHYGLSGKKLNFEIMEDTVSQNIENLSSLLQKVKAKGIGVEIDDYGTGHTSLNYLISLPIDAVKIDRSFVTDIDNNRKKYALLCAIVDMAKALELEVIIEGVETAEEMEMLKSFDHVTVQGYYYARPMEEEAFLSKITESV